MQAAGRVAWHKVGQLAASWSTLCRGCRCRWGCQEVRSAYLQLQGQHTQEQSRVQHVSVQGPPKNGNDHAYAQAQLWQTIHAADWASCGSTERLAHFAVVLQHFR